MRSSLVSFLFVLCLSCTAYSQIAVVGDLNGDGKPDVVVGNGNLNTVSIFINNGNGIITATRFPAVSRPVQAVALADFNMDGHLDILVFDPPGFEILFGDGTGNFSAVAPVVTGGVPFDGGIPVIGDFNGDGIPDIAVPGVFLLFGDGHGGFSAPQRRLIALQGAGQASIFVTDANNDGKPDLVLGGEIGVSSFVCYLAINNGTGGFTSTAFVDAVFLNVTACRPTPDLNSDGTVDFLTQFSIFFGDGSGGLFYTQPRINSSKVADGIAVDFDHNGTTDLV